MWGRQRTGKTLFEVRNYWYNAITGRFVEERMYRRYLTEMQEVKGRRKPKGKKVVEAENW